MIITHYYFIITQGFVIAHYCTFQTDKLADVTRDPQVLFQFLNSTISDAKVYRVSYFAVIWNTLFIGFVFMLCRVTVSGVHGITAELVHVLTETSGNFNI